MKKLRGRVEKFKGLAVGLDLHKKFIAFSVLVPQGKEIEAGTMASEPQTLESLIERLRSPPAAAGLRVGSHRIQRTGWDTRARRDDRNCSAIVP